MVAPQSLRSPRPLLRQTVTGATVAELRRRILSGAVAAGEALRQDALAREFGISRIPLREAFHQLAAEGLVTLHPHRGAVVTELSAADIAELFDLRAMLEPDLIRRAVPRLTATDFERAETILADYAAAIGRGDLEAYGELNREYHLSSTALPAAARRSNWCVSCSPTPTATPAYSSRCRRAPPPAPSASTPRCSISAARAMRRGQPG